MTDATPQTTHSTPAPDPATEAPGVRPVLDLVVLDCPDPMALGRFYAEILGWALEAGSDAEWVTLEPPGGRGSSGLISLAFQQVTDYQPPTWPTGPRPQHFHLDLNV